MPKTAERAPPASAKDALSELSCLPADGSETKPTERPAQIKSSRDPRAVREARLELIREAIFENLGGARLFIETAQLLIEARDDTGMAHAVRMGAHHYRAVVLLAKDIAALKAEGQQ